MLTAKLANGKIFSLSDNYSKEQLLLKREQEKFFCPICDATVTLRLGKQRVWHFAHQKREKCTIEVEKESQYHLRGKLQLFKWLLKQQYLTTLEKYLPNIQQRPDIVLSKENLHFAIEYQCSPISIELLLKRTKGYIYNQITPLWIIGGNRFKRKGQYFSSISQFEWSTTRYLNKPLIIYYCSEKKQFLLVCPLVTVSSTLTFAKLQFLPVYEMTFPKLINMSNKFKVTKENILFIKRHWRYSHNLYPSKAEMYIMKLWLREKLSFPLFPSEAGWPTTYHHLLETPPHVWQSWILLYFIRYQPIDRKFTLQMLENSFLPLIRSQIFRVRSFIFFQPDISKVLFGYLKFLERINFLTSTGNQMYIRNKEVQVPKSMDEAVQMDQRIINFLTK